MAKGPPELVDLGQAVRAFRRARGWSRRELAERARVSERFLADIEGGRGNVSVLRLCELASALGTTASRLLAALPDHQRRAVALLGLRGAGKSTVGARLAQALGCPFVELDQRIEETAGLSLDDMFQVHGEAYYRRVEHDVLQEVLQSEGPLVLATGGGIVTDAPSFALLEQRAHTVWLRAEPKDHWTRVVTQGDTRPMAGNDRAFADLCALLEEREPMYRKAQVVVETSGRRVEEVCAELADRFAFLGPAAG